MLLDLIWEAENHEDGRSANLAFAGESKAFVDFDKGLATADEIEDRVLQHRAATAGNKADTQEAEEPDDVTDSDAASAADMDMSFSSLTPAPAAAPPVPANAKREPARKRKDPPPQIPAKTLAVRSRSASPSSVASSPTSSGRGRDVVTKPHPAATTTPTASTPKAVAKAEKLMGSKGLALTPANLWANKPRSRAIEQASKALEDGGSQLLGIEAATAQALMADMLRTAELAPRINDLFIRLRKNSKEFIHNMSPGDVDVWDQIGAKTMETILTTLAMQLLKDLEQDSRLFLAVDCL